MTNKIIPLVVLALLLSFGSSSAQHRSTSTHHTSRYTTGVARDSHGNIKRSESAKRQFEKQTGYPHGRPGYVVDHIKPLSKGGADSPSNMQWQTKADAKAKDKWERGPSKSTVKHTSHKRR